MPYFSWTFSTIYWVFLTSHFFCLQSILRIAVCSTKTTDYIINLLGPITYIKWGTFFFLTKIAKKKIGQFQISKKYVQSQNEIAFEHNSYIMCVWYFFSDIFPIESFFAIGMLSIITFSFHLYIAYCSLLKYLGSKSKFFENYWVITTHSVPTFRNEVL